MQGAVQETAMNAGGMSGRPFCLGPFTCAMLDWNAGW